MRAGLIVSTAMHAGLIAIAFLGLGFGQPIEATPVESIAVDLVPISDFSNIRVGSLDSTIVETETPSAVNAETPAEIAQPTGNTEEDQPTPEDTPDPTPAPTVQTAPAPEATEPEPEPEPVEEAARVPVERPVEPPPPAPELEPEPEPVVEPEPPAVETPPLAVDTPAPDPADAAPRPIMKTAALAEKRADFKKQQEAAKQKAADDAKAAADAKKKAEEEKKKADDAKKAADKKKADEQRRIEQARAEQAKQADELASIINNEESRGATTGEGGEQTLGRQDGRSATLSQSQIDGLVSQIRGCIAVPPGASEAGSEAQLLFSVAGDGSLVAQPQVVSLTGDTVADAYARAVTRAVMRCGPYAVVAGQDVKATFRARDF
jgi:colicin import membrane protein